MRLTGAFGSRARRRWTIVLTVPVEEADSSEMQLQSLGYFSFAADKIEHWSAFATGLFGMQVIDLGNKRASAADGRRQGASHRRPRQPATAAIFGWEVMDGCARLTQADSATGPIHGHFIPHNRRRHSLAMIETGNYSIHPLMVAPRERPTTGISDACQRTAARGLYQRRLQLRKKGRH